MKSSQQPSGSFTLLKPGIYYVLCRNLMYVFYFIFRTAKLIMREMIQTERDYVRALEYVIEVSSRLSRGNSSRLQFRIFLLVP